MDPRLRFGLSIVLSFLTWGLVARYYFWPALRTQSGRARFRPILLLHASRFVGLAFLVSGVVSPDLPIAFAAPAAYGDLIAALLALATLATLEKRIGLLLLWVFNLWGTGDLLFAYYQGVIGVGVEPGSLGAMYFVPTVVVPLLLVTHILAFRMLLAAPQRRA
jgi:hypothetical protein